jgi:hypothetical protein
MMAWASSSSVTLGLQCCFRGQSGRPLPCRAKPPPRSSLPLRFPGAAPARDGAATQPTADQAAPMRQSHHGHRRGSALVRKPRARSRRHPSLLRLHPQPDPSSRLELPGGHDLHNPR